jgi:hypothetical protein
MNRCGEVKSARREARILGSSISEAAQYSSLRGKDVRELIALLIYKLTGTKIPPIF